MMNSNNNNQAASRRGSQQQRFNEYDGINNDSFNSRNFQVASGYSSSSNQAAAAGHRGSATSASSASRHQYHQQLNNKANLPTKISITAPSPMGSMREVNRASTDSGNLMYGSQMSGNQSSRMRQQQQQHFQQEQEELMMIERAANDLSLSGGGGGGYGDAEQQNCCSEQRLLFDEELQMLRNDNNINININNNNNNNNIDISEEEAINQLVEARGSASLSKDSSCSDTTANRDGGKPADGKSRSQLIDELLRTINDDSFNDFVDFNNKFAAQTTTTTSTQFTPAQLASSNRPKSAIDSTLSSRSSQGNPSINLNRQQSSRPTALALGGGSSNSSNHTQQQQRSINATTTTPSTFDNVIRRMSTNFVQNFNKMSANTLGTNSSDQSNDVNSTNLSSSINNNNVRREKSSNVCTSNNLYVDNQIPARRHSDNTINVPRIQVALSSPCGSSRTNLNQKASLSASKLANKWKLTAKTNQRESSDKLSPVSGALSYMRRHSSGTNSAGNDQNHSNGSNSNLLFNASPFRTKSSSNLGFEFLLSNKSMKRRCSAASMIGHQTQRKAEDLIDAGMKSVQNMFS